MSSHSLETPTYLPGKTNSSENMGGGVLTLPKGSCVLSGSQEWPVSWTPRPASKDAGLQHRREEQLLFGEQSGLGLTASRGRSPFPQPQTVWQKQSVPRKRGEQTPLHRWASAGHGQAVSHGFGSSGATQSGSEQQREAKEEERRRGRGGRWTLGPSCHRGWGCWHNKEGTGHRERRNSLALPGASLQTSSAGGWEPQHHDTRAPGDAQVKAFGTEKVIPDVL